MNAVPLAAAEYGAGPPLVILHGLFGSGRNWASVAQKLGQARRVHALDLRNHGASPWADAMDYPSLAGDVVAYMRTHGLIPAAVMGHSMGGKTAMRLALDRPEMVERLVVVDIAPVPRPTELLGHVRAMRALDLAALRRRADADRALATAIPDAAVRAFLVQNLVAGEDGHLAWRLNLEVIERRMDEIVGWPDPGRRRFEGPTLFVAGGRSDHLGERHMPQIREVFPQARLAVVAEAGHWVHAERPAPFLEAVAGFLGAG